MIADRSRGSRRRTFLKTLGGVGMVGVAGCIGGGGDDEPTDTEPGASPADGEPETTDLVVTTSGEATAVFAASQGVGAVVNDNTDEVFLDVRPSEGFAANVGILERGEADIGVTSNFIAPPILNREAPFDEHTFDLTQIFHIHNTAWFLASGNADWSSVSDITANSRLSPFPRGTSVREMWDYALEEVLGLDYEHASIGIGDQGGALNEGRIDAASGAFTNPSVTDPPSEPGWLEQMKSTTDLRVLGTPDDMASAIENDSRLTLAEADASGLEGYAHLPSPLRVLSLVSYWVAPASTSAAGIRSMLETIWDNRDGLGEYHALLDFHSDSEWWVADALSDVPFHPEAESFYRDNGIWQDSFTSYE